LSSIRVVPNPYNIASPGMQYPGEPDKIMFLNIPGHCTIRIYTENGDLINQIEHENGSGDETWNSNTSSRQVVVSGIYIVHFTVTADYTDPTTGELMYKKGETAYQKLIVIR
jgi:ubiquitin-protein ligase